MRFQYLVFIIIAIWSFNSRGQEDRTSENLGDCSGAVQHQLNTSMEAEFTGKAGFENDTKLYHDRLRLSSYNTFWITTHPPTNGQLSLKLTSLPHPTEIALFQTQKIDACKAIHEQRADLIYSVKKTTENVSSIEVTVSPKYRYYLYINTSKDTKADFSLSSSFQPKDQQSGHPQLEKKVDLREQDGNKAITVRIVDSTTQLPIDAAIMIEGSKSFNALYNANVLIFPDNKYLSFRMQVNAEGYMFKDTMIDCRTIESDTITIGMNTFKRKDQIQIDGIQFKSESHELVESAKPAIRKLRDFLAMNRDIKIELIGHVFKEGRNTWRAQYFSKKRAKRVKSYLVQNGIQEDRISVKGKGNSEMIYPEPSTETEIKANRRVEIKIK